ncbi:hypothetical protein [Campylobacter concisus]|uniref:hypothetical protein n=1 Tax=Campylobacter concisus TaxID=199 RepID=UPI0015E15DD7|nr:hypothetical protein [Campylobacter concisus]
MLKFVKTLALFGYFDFKDFHSTFDKFTLPKQRLFSLSSLPYSYISSNFLHKATSFLL